MNPFELLKNVNVDELKKKSQEALSSLKDIVVTGEAGGGFVKITMTGEFSILSIDYETNDIIEQDISMFRDLVISAHNDAVIKIKAEIQKKFAGSFIPGLF